MWRNSGLAPSFFGLDARCLLPMMVFFVHISLFTFCFALVFVVFFAFLVYRGFTITTAGLYFRSWLVGTRRSADLFYEQRTRGYPEDGPF